MQKVSMNTKKFEQDYFCGWYKKIIGSFSESDLKRSRKWFWAWFNYLNNFADLKNGNGRKVLEIGCANGGAASILYDRGFDVYASDISNYAINKAKKFLPKIKFYKIDVEKEIPLKERFDIIYAFEVIEHLKNPQKAIKIMKKSLNKNGLLICSTPPAARPDIYKDPTHINLKNKDQWKKIFENMGFSKIIMKHVAYFPILWRLYSRFNFVFPFGIVSRFVFSPLFIIAKNEKKN